MPSKDRCIVAGCRHRKMADSVYCGNKCVERHAFASLELIRNERARCSAPTRRYRSAIGWLFEGLLPFVVVTCMCNFCLVALNRRHQ